MSIRIDRTNNRITLRTRHTEYVMEILYGKYPVHLYYGRRTRNVPDRRHWGISFAPYYPAHGLDYLPDMEMSECPTWGAGDFRAPSLRLCDLSSGDDSAHFVFRSAQIIKGRADIPGIPYARADEHTKTLALTLTDTYTDPEKPACELTLYYTVFPEEDVITRYHTVRNATDRTFRITRDMSFCLDLPRDAATLDLIAFHGAYGQERRYERTPVMYGNQRLFSRRGSSSHQFNPNFFLCDRKATEEGGDCWGFNLVWSGSFSAEIETEQTGTVRVTEGLGDECFAYDLAPGESFTSPEGVLTYSANGIGEASRQFHRFVRGHILPPEPFATRPVVLNSWEACYFQIDEEILVRFAREAAACGMDMLVMDDGWFGARTDDRRGLGDWWYNPDRFPHGLKAFVDRVHAEGVRFGIWVEPEMVNPDSDLYRAHPDWVLGAPDRARMESRQQLVLDMGNPAVVQYLKESFAACFDGIGIDYFKWDMNRHLTGVWSSVLPPERQKEAYFRYVLGTYELFRFFRAHFPGAMIENCSGGGGRYDLAMMTFSTQIWASDNTDPYPRTLIQYSSTFGYPTATMSCHVSNHKNAVEDPLRMAHNYHTAINGPLGYELNILHVSDEAKQVIRKQIADYRRFEPLILRGDFYRLLNPYEGSRYAFYFASEDNRRLLLTCIQNYPEKKPQTARLKVSRALPGVTYRDEMTGETYTGDELRRGLVHTATENAPACRTWFLSAIGG